MKMKIFVLLLSIFISNSLFAQVRYERITIGSGFAVDVNNNGQIVGYDDIKPWLWENGRFTELYFPGYSYSPLAINNSGQILAQTIYGESGGRGLVWENGVVTDLGIDYCEVWDINDQGSIAGRSIDDESFIIEDGILRRLDWNYSHNDRATGINNLGQVAGTDYYNAFLWEDGRFTLLPGLSSFSKKSAYNINDKGQIVGESEIGEFGSPAHACLWEKDESGHYQVQDLGSFDNGGTMAIDLNNHGQVVGNSGSYHALTWVDGQVIDLGLGTAWAINDNGWIVGECGWEAVIWKPVPEPATFLLLMTGVIFLRTKTIC